MREPPFVIHAPSSRYFLADHCANCLELLPDDEDTLFCSTWCSEIAIAVRYQRGVFRDDRGSDPLVQRAVSVKNAFLLAGGYQALGRELDKSIRIAVKVRDDGKCQKCGGPGRDIDHISDNSSELSNLQLLCASCHNVKTAQSLVPASPAQKLQLLALQLARVVPEVPALLADDQHEWRHIWRALKAERKQRLVDRLETAGVEPRRMKSRVEMLIALANSSRTEPSRAVDPDNEYPLPNWDWHSDNLDC